MKMTTEIPIAIIHEGESRREILTLLALPAVKIILGDNRTEVEVILVLQGATKGVVRQGAMGCPLGPTGDLPAMDTVAQRMGDHMAVAVVHQGAKHHHRAREETLEVKGVKEVKVKIERGLFKMQLLVKRWQISSQFSLGPLNSFSGVFSYEKYYQRWR